METKKEKKSLVKRAKDWWNDLPERKKKGINILCAMGACFAGGLCAGRSISNTRKEKIANEAGEKGYALGQIEAYKDIARSNPFNDIKNPTVTKF